MKTQHPETYEAAMFSLVQLRLKHDAAIEALHGVVTAHKTGDFYDRGRKVHDLIPNISAIIAAKAGAQ